MTRAPCRCLDVAPCRYAIAGFSNDAATLVARLLLMRRYDDADIRYAMRQAAADDAVSRHVRQLSSRRLLFDSDDDVARCHAELLLIIMHIAFSDDMPRC